MAPSVADLKAESVAPVQVDLKARVFISMPFLDYISTTSHNLLAIWIIIPILLSIL